jgi:hypothetical protein
MRQIVEISPATRSPGRAGFCFLTIGGPHDAIRPIATPQKMSIPPTLHVRLSCWIDSRYCVTPASVVESSGLAMLTGTNAAGTDTPAALHALISQSTNPSESHLP